MTGTTFRGRLAQVVELVGSAAELARRSGMSDRSIRGYAAGETEPKGEVIVRLAAAGGVRVEWLLTGAEPMTNEAPKAEQPAAGYQAPMNRGLMAEVIRAVDQVLLKAGGDRAELIMLAYDYMLARGTTERGVLESFLGQWARSLGPQPAREITWPLVDQEPGAPLQPGGAERRVRDEGPDGDQPERRKAQK